MLHDRERNKHNMYKYYLSVKRTLCAECENSLDPKAYARTIDVAHRIFRNWVPRLLIDRDKSQIGIG